MKFLNKLKNSKTAEYIFLGVISLAVIIILAVSFAKPAETNANVTDETVVYIRELEKRMEKALSQVRGAGEVSVVITAESGKETVLASETVTVTDENGKITVTETPIMVNGKPVVLKENVPKITGVLIVAQGADSIGVMKNIQQAAVSLLNIEVSRIEILARN
ncbi:MAG: hypothetical protein DBX59_09850 [Bacillota bacterium]|nr:MAG: hypothetical protein DBX59_09850 [Bacillota bacterium]